ncbi:hypothetical protein [Primorskyibacter sp. S187A]|uniref:hypothetical protein n=1 Tax=Primorskyibacter sp. S187A TaxID=3415130 RepID=UPI003C7DD90A
MLVERMCGVVLWSSDDDAQAVIWCEDHGNLAFYTAQETDMHAGLALDAGDLIDFELDDAAEHRLAHNPRLLVEDHAPNLAQGLRGCSDPDAGAPPVTAGTAPGKIVRFPGAAAA